MARNNDRGGSTARRAPKDNGRRVKKKPCALCKDRVEWVDYKDVAMLRKYMSDRGKIRARRVSGNCTQHQRDTQRTTTERPGGRGGRGGRDGGFGGGRRGRDEERTLGEEGASTAIPDGTPPAAVQGEVEVVEVEVVELDTGEEIVVVEGSGEES